MGTVRTAQDAAERLVDHVSRHGCGSLACDVCSDLESCLVATPRPRPTPLPPLRVASARPARANAQDASADVMASPFSGWPDCY